jgi:hypothetical protein
MNKQSLNKYFSLARKINFLESPQGDSLKKLLPVIEELSKSCQDEGYRNFFIAEKAFIQKSFQKALKHYLLAKEVPDLHFFCHRCNSLIYKDLGKYRESLDSFKKALNHLPEDKTTVQLSLLLKKEIQAEVEKKRKANTETASVNLTEETTESTEDEDLVSLISLKESNFIKKFQESYIENKEKEINPSQLFLNDSELQDLDAMFESDATSEIDFEEDSYSSFDLNYNNLNQENDFNLDHIEGDAEETYYISSPLNKSFEEKEGEINLSDLTFPREEEKFESPWEEIELDQACNFAPSSQSSHFKEPNDPSSLTSSLNTYHMKQQKIWEQYYGLRKKENNNFLTLTDYSMQEAASPLSSATVDNFLNFPRQFQSSPEGIFFKWQGTGIAINPSEKFLSKLHLEGITLFDINYILTNSPSPSVLKEIEQILSLKDKANENLPESHEIKVLHFSNSTENDPISISTSNLQTMRINPIKPSIEKLPLSPSIDLFYFNPYLPLKQQEGFLENSPKHSSSVGLTFQLHSSTEDEPISIGILPKGPFSPHFQDYFLGSQLIVADIGSLSDKMPTSTVSSHDFLGYNGLQSIVHAFPDSLCLLYHLGPPFQSFKFEVIKDLRKEVETKTGRSPLLFPSAPPTIINLEEMSIMCHSTKNFTSPADLKVFSSPFPAKKLSFVNKNLLL